MFFLLIMYDPSCLNKRLTARCLLHFASEFSYSILEFPIKHENASVGKIDFGSAFESLLSLLIMAGGRVKSRSVRIDASESGAVAGGCECGRAAATPHATMHCVYR